MIRGLHHAALSVPDLEAAIAFYTEALGTVVVMRNAWRDSKAADRFTGLVGTEASMVMLRGPGFLLELFEYASPEPGSAPRGLADYGLTHLCFEVDDAAQEHARLASLGVRFVAAPSQVGGARAAYGRDPFGNLIEILERTGDFPDARSR